MHQQRKRVMDVAPYRTFESRDLEQNITFAETMIARQRRERLNRIHDIRSLRALLCCTNPNVQIIWPHDGGELAIRLGLRLKLTTTDQNQRMSPCVRPCSLLNTMLHRAWLLLHVIESPLAKSSSCVGPLSDQVAPRNEIAPAPRVPRTALKIGLLDKNNVISSYMRYTMDFGLFSIIKLIVVSFFKSYTQMIYTPLT